jgi:hypothetical protein
MTAQEPSPGENGTSTRGRPFGKGNPGRRRGSKNRKTAVAQALLAGEEAELIRKAVEIALSGDVQMLKFLLDRLLPKDRLIRFDLPTADFADEAIERMAAITAKVAEGEIIPAEAAALSKVISDNSRVIETFDLTQWVEALEDEAKDLKLLVSPEGDSIGSKAHRRKKGSGSSRKSGLGTSTRARPRHQSSGNTAVRCPEARRAAGERMETSLNFIELSPSAPNLSDRLRAVPTLSGSTENEKIANVFRSAPSWLRLFCSLFVDCLALGIKLGKPSDPLPITGRDGLHERSSWPELPKGTLIAGRAMANSSGYDGLESEERHELISLLRKGEENWIKRDRKRYNEIMSKVDRGELSSVLSA